jgi:hypothetical protein
MERFDELPVCVQLNVLGFLYDDLGAKFLSNKNAVTCHRNGAAIHSLAAVCKSWATAIDAVEGHFQDSVLVFDFQEDPVACSAENCEHHDEVSIEYKQEVIPVGQAPSRGIFQLAKGLLGAFACTSNNRPTRRLSEERESSEVVGLEKKELAMQRKAQHVESELKRLLHEASTGKQPRLRVELWLRDPLDVTIHGCEEYPEGNDGLQYWGKLFSNCQYLLRLDLSGIPMESDHLPVILNAVGAHCASLEELVMPQQTHLTHRRRSVHQVLDAFHAMLASLDVLSRSGKRSGLRKLVLPCLFPNESVDAMAAIVGEHCPNLTQIEGLRLAAFSRRRRLTSVEMRQSSLQSWEAFCKGCSHLAALDWCSLPCSEEGFDIFAKYPKLDLKTLVLPGNTARWRREYVLQERHHIDPLSPSNRLAPVLRACPNLTALEVRLSDMQGDSEFLGDQFLQHVVDSCPLLERLALVEASAHHGFGPSNAVTSEGLHALMGLRRLRAIELNGVSFSEETLLSLAIRPRPSSQPRTRLDVTLGARGWNAVDVATYFHETLAGFLQLLLAPEASGFPAFIIRVRPDTHKLLPPARWETRFKSEWNKAKRELAPKIRLHYDYLRAEATMECQSDRTV